MSHESRSSGTESVPRQPESQSEAVPKIEVHRPEAHPEPLYRRGTEDAAHYIAIVTDAVELEADVPVLNINSTDLITELADLVERRVLGSLAAD